MVFPLNACYDWDMSEKALKVDRVKEIFDDAYVLYKEAIGEQISILKMQGG